MALEPGPNTFSLERLRRIWRNGQPRLGQHYLDKYRHFNCDSGNRGEPPKAATRFCLTLFSSVQDPSDHISQLDASFDPLFLQPFLQMKLTETAVSPGFPILMVYLRQGHIKLAYLDADALLNTRY